MGVIRFALCISALFLVATAAAAQVPEGRYKGSLIRDGWPLSVTVEFGTADKDGVGRAIVSVDEWLSYAPSKRRFETGDKLTIDRFYGGKSASLELVKPYGHWVGKVGDDVRLVLRPAPRDPMFLVSTQNVQFTVGSAMLQGSLVRPVGIAEPPAMLLIAGRGCEKRNSGLARAFARRGIAALVMDRRGADESQGDCATLTFDQLTADAVAAFQYLSAVPGIDSRRVGLLGTSLGGWVAQAAAARQHEIGRPASFLVTWIAPATSILDQQLQSAESFATMEDFDAERRALIQRSVILAAKGGRAAFAELSALRAKAKSEGWLENIYANDDLPERVEDGPKLFLQRFRYDPARDRERLSAMPYLSILGSADPVVPLEPNREAFNALTDNGGKGRLVILDGLGHATEHGDKVIRLSDGERYFKHDTVEPRYFIETISFIDNL